MIEGINEIGDIFKWCIWGRCLVVHLGTVLDSVTPFVGQKFIRHSKGV